MLNLTILIRFLIFVAGTAAGFMLIVLHQSLTVAEFYMTSGFALKAMAFSAVGTLLYHGSIYFLGVDKLVADKINARQTAKLKRQLEELRSRT